MNNMQNIHTDSETAPTLIGGMDIDTFLELARNLLKSGIQIHIHPDNSVTFSSYNQAKRTNPTQRLAQKQYSARRKLLMCSSREWQELRSLVLKRDSERCVYCGGDGGEFSLECDHVIPVSKGGVNQIDNLVTACKRCNASKRAEDVTHWRAKRGL